MQADTMEKDEAVHLATEFNATSFREQDSLAATVPLAYTALYQPESACCHFDQLRVCCGDERPTKMRSCEFRLPSSLRRLQFTHCLADAPGAPGAGRVNSLCELGQSPYPRRCDFRGLTYSVAVYINVHCSF
jgi:hypothetical protein